MQFTRHRGRRPALALLICITGACTSGRQLIPPLPSPRDIPELETEVSRSPDDTELVVRLGAAYREAGDFARARDLLELAREQDPTDPGAAIFLGLSYEDLGQFAEARAVYESYLADPANIVLRGQLEERMPLLRRQELQLAVSNALLLDEGRPVQENSVAVLPFLYRVPDPEYRPLRKAMAAMLITDLSQTDRLAVLERLQVQLLVDEIELGATELADPASAARSGRLLGSANVVQGLIDGDVDLLRIEAAVVDARNALAGTSVREQDAVAQLLDMEKRLVFRVFDELGIELTPAERDRISRRPTNNIRALLEYGRGLEAEDVGNYAQAVAHYRRAVEIDPGFNEAQEKIEPTTQIAQASLLSTGVLAQASADNLLPPLEIQDLTDVLNVLDDMAALIPDTDGRDPASEVTGNEGLGTRAAILEIVIRRPGGDQ